MINFFELVQFVNVLHVVSNRMSFLKSLLKWIVAKNTWNIPTEKRWDMFYSILFYFILTMAI